MSRLAVDGLEHDTLLSGVWRALGTPQCLLTGGYLRDRLLGRPSADLDLVLRGDLEAARGPARRLAARLDTSAHLLGRGDRRVWHIATPRLKVELWPLGGLSLDEDIARRDFSCNALMWPLPAGPLDDRVGGLADLEARLLRAIARDNLEDDPVRLVRAARFLAEMPDFQLELRTAGWIRRLAPRIRQAPKERVGQELLKLVTAAGAERGLRALISLGLLTRSAPVTRCDEAWLAEHMEAASRMRPAAHPLRAALAAASQAPPLALLLRAWGRPDADAIAPYAWPRSLRRHAVFAAGALEAALAAVEGGAAERRSLIHRTGASFPAVLAFAAAVQPGRPWRSWWRLWRERGAELVHPEPLLSGEEIAAVLGLAPGPRLGRAVDALTDAQVRGQVRTREGAVRWLRSSVEC